MYMPTIFAVSGAASKGLHVGFQVVLRFSHVFLQHQWRVETAVWAKCATTLAARICVVDRYARPRNLAKCILATLANGLRQLCIRVDNIQLGSRAIHYWKGGQLASGRLGCWMLNLSQPSAPQGSWLVEVLGHQECPALGSDLCHPPGRSLKHACFEKLPIPSAPTHIGNTHETHESSSCTDMKYGRLSTLNQKTMTAAVWDSGGSVCS